MRILLETQIADSDFSQVVCGVTERARSICQFYVAVAGHKANDWFECAWI